MLETGSEAIDFTLPDEHDDPVVLHDFRGKKVALYFYPKDNTSGCTRQACVSKAAYEESKREDVVIIGISRDSSASHMRSREEYGLPFLLPSDTELSVIQAYNVWEGKKLYGRTYMGITRSTYIIGKEGVIIKTFEGASPANNTADILQYVKDAR